VAEPARTFSDGPTGPPDRGAVRGTAGPGSARAAAGSASAAAGSARAAAGSASAAAGSASAAAAAGPGAAVLAGRPLEAAVIDVRLVEVSTRARPVGGAAAMTGADGLEPAGERAFAGDPCRRG
jgi:hypothetical protein